jgi:hypothetical protein
MPGLPIRKCEPHDVPVGSACDPADVANHCVDGATCRAGVCTGIGKLGGLCRVREPAGACDASLSCQAGGCVAGLLPGAACDPTAARATVCGLPAICATAGGASTCQVHDYAEQALSALPFIEACDTGTHVPLELGAGGFDVRQTGHAAAPIALPFTFQFFGSARQQVWPSTRGFVTFGGKPFHDAGLGNGFLASDDFGALTAPFWEDIYLDVAPASDICWTVAGTAPNRAVAIEWKHAHRFGWPSTDLTFEVVLHETTNVIDFAYATLAPQTGDASAYADGGRAAIGLQSGDSGKAVVHSGIVTVGGGLRFTPQ